MLSLYARRVALSTRRSTATYAHISQSSASTLRYRGTLGNNLHTNAVQSFANPQRNASTRAAATTKEPRTPAGSATMGKRKPGQTPTPEEKAARLQAKLLERQKKAEKAAALRAKRNAQAEKKREAAARKRLAEKKKREAQKAKEKEAKTPMIKPPPRRMNSFSLFLQESKKPVQEVSADWNNLSDEAKQDYAARAKAVTEKRKEEFDTFLKSVTLSDVRRYNRLQKSKGRNRIRVPTETNRPLGSFIRFTQVFRNQPDQAGKSIVQVARAAGEAWRSFAQEEKDKYKVVPSESATA